jgi:hypothetical protein
MVGYGPFSLCVIHKEGLCTSSGDNKVRMKKRLDLSIILYLRGGWDSPSLVEFLIHSDSNLKHVTTPLSGIRERECDEEEDKECEARACR